MNSLTIAGQLGKDAEIKYLNNGDPVASFSVADSQGKNKSTIWWRCSLFGKRAESLAPYLMKGQAVTVTGTLTEREYTDKDGMQKKAQEVRVNDVALQGGKRDDAPQRAAAPAQRPQAKPAAMPPRAESGFSDMDNDIPFISCDFALEVDTSKAKRIRRYDF
jgi:single-strand DNA-binding protein